MAISDIFKPKTEEEIDREYRRRFQEEHGFDPFDYDNERLPADLNDVFAQYYKLTHKRDGSVKYSRVDYDSTKKFGNTLDEIKPKFDLEPHNYNIFGQEINESKVRFEDYILILDRLLERQGLSSKERDAIFNDPNNIDLISNSFEKRVHPSIILKQLDKEPVRAMYASSSEVTEAVKGRKILSPQQQADLNKNIPLSKGKKYAVDFLKSVGLLHISTPLQLKRGTLIFLDPKNNVEWQISGTGYLRKRNLNKKGVYLGPEWQMIYSHFPPQYQQGGKKFLQDDEYMDMAEKLSEKIRGDRARKEITFRKSYVDRLYRLLNDEIKEKLIPLHARSRYEWEWEVTKEEVAEAVKKLHDKYVK